MTVTVDDDELDDDDDDDVQLIEEIEDMGEIDENDDLGDIEEVEEIEELEELDEVEEIEEHLDEGQHSMDQFEIEISQTENDVPNPTESMGEDHGGEDKEYIGIVSVSYEH